MTQLKTENDFLRQELIIYKSHLHKISKFFEILMDTNDISLRQGIEEVKSYLEKNFLDKLSDSLVFDENNNFYEKGNFLTPNINLSNSKIYGFLFKNFIVLNFFLDKNLSDTNFLRFRSSGRKKTLNFPLEKSNLNYEPYKNIYIRQKLL